MNDDKKLVSEDLLWFKDAVIYELHIKAFYDGNNDGIGDFKGLLQKLDYLQDLGVTAIWVLPFYPSPLRDDGYDIADYYSINPSYGTIDEFRSFLTEAHKRNLKVITELVINHTSDQHPWFQRARSAPRGSAERAYYVWTDNPKQYKDVRIIFQDYESSNWTWDPVAQQYYWHRFFHHQPDLNYESQIVQDEVFKIIDYWCAMGVDGFRLDAVPYLYEREGTNGENLPETHEFLKKLRKHIDDNFPGTVLLAEANMWPEDSASYFGNGDECHMNYHFPVMPRMFMSLQREDRYPITDIFDQTPAIPENCQWAMFLRNHDELTLEMVTDEERDFMYKAYAKDPKAKINLGIRHRLAPLMDNNRRKIELMNSLLFALPGTPVLYYGDEIGMGDNFYLGDRDGVRTPMQWSPDRNAGFSATNPQRLYLPVILDPQYHYESVNVETQRSNTSSLFWFMKRLIGMRKNYKAFGRGSLEFINSNNSKILAFIRSSGEENLLIVVNFSKYAQPVELNLSKFNGNTPVEVFSRNKFPAIKESNLYFLTLDGYSFQWFTLKPATTANAKREILKLKTSPWEGALTEKAVTMLENIILPSYITGAQWFLHQNKTIISVSIKRRQILEGTKAVWIIAEIQYENEVPELYQLPVSIAEGDNARYIRENYPNALIAEFENESILTDALYDPLIQKELWLRFARSENQNHLSFQGTDKLQELKESEMDFKPKVHTSDLIHTTLAFDNRFFLTMYRKVEPGIHPDVEIIQFLSSSTPFPIPGMNGLMEWKTPEENIVLGMIQVMVENHGDASSFMTERISNYIERILARDKSITRQYVKSGTLADPLTFDSLDEGLKEFLGSQGSSYAKLIGIRTGQLHLALSSGLSKEFLPEPFSLHYQRSLFSSMQAITRETFQNMSSLQGTADEETRNLIELLLQKKNSLTEIFKGVYASKMDALKIRIHGRYILKQILLTGNDITVKDFSGNPLKPFSERRLKRSPLRDVATMYRSIYYTAFEGFLQSPHIQKTDLDSIYYYAGLWAHYMGGFFIHGFLDTVKDSALIPSHKNETEKLLRIFILENTLFHLNYDLLNRVEHALIPASLLVQLLSFEEQGKE